MIIIILLVTPESQLGSGDLVVNAFLRSDPHDCSMLAVILHKGNEPFCNHGHPEHKTQNWIWCIILGFTLVHGPNTTVFKIILVIIRKKINMFLPY